MKNSPEKKFKRVQKCTKPLGFVQNQVIIKIKKYE